MKETTLERRCCATCGHPVLARTHASADSALIEHERYHRWLAAQPKPS